MPHKAPRKPQKAQKAQGGTRRPPGCQEIQKASKGFKKLQDRTKNPEGIQEAPSCRVLCVID
eukprot:6810385-Pyramimonas_sp.AAC.1